MKKKIRKTGEVIDVVTYSCDTEPKYNDTIGCIDSNGNKKTLNLNYYWDLEDYDSSENEEKYWRDLKNKAAIKIFCHKFCNNDLITTQYMMKSIELANTFVNYLKNSQ